MADDKTTKTPEQPVTDSGPGKETPPAPPKEPEKVSVSPEPEKKTEPEVKNPQVSVYNFAEIMKEKKAEERAAAPGVEKPDPAKVEKPEKQPEAPKKTEGKQEKLLLKMMEEAKDMIHNSVEAFVEGDEANAQKVVEHDDVVDDLFNDMKKEMMQAIREQNLDADRVVDYLMMAKYLEKVGDHAVNIAQWAIFRMTGDMEGVKLY